MPIDHDSATTATVSIKRSIVEKDWISMDRAGNQLLKPAMELGIRMTIKASVVICSANEPLLDTDFV